MTITFGINARVLGFAMLLARLFLTHCGARMDGFYKYVFVTYVPHGGMDYGMLWMQNGDGDQKNGFQFL
jgi:hypothetical protein